MNRESQLEVGAHFTEQLVVVEAAAEQRSRALEMSRDRISLSRVQRLRRGVPLEIDFERRQRACAAAGIGIEAERDQLFAKRRIGERRLRDRVVLVLANQREAEPVASAAIGADARAAEILATARRGRRCCETRKSAPATTTSSPRAAATIPAGRETAR